MDWRYYLIYLAAFSLTTFVLYGFDKARSKNNGWRVPEAVLHWLALLGGFPGAFAGRAIFHHKTRKSLFGFVLTVSTAIHTGLAYWLFFR